MVVIMAKDTNNRETRSAWLKLILGLWGVFLVVLIIFILCTRHVIG